MTPLRLKKGHEEAVRAGCPWIYRGDIIDSSELLQVPPGSVVAIENYKGQAVGTGYFNAKSAIACRVLTLKAEPIDVAFFKKRLEKALMRREKIIDVPYYRLAHSEADGLPGLLIDRFGEVLVAQVGTAGMELLQPLWMQAVQEVLKPGRVILRNEAAARRLEGLVVASPSPAQRGRAGEWGFPQEPYMEYPAPVPSLILPREGRERGYIVELQENNCIYYADLEHGQKTGWFYDQRDNRRMIAEMAKGKTLLDVYAHSGGFGVLAAKHGAARVTLVDSSKLALELAALAAARNGVAGLCDSMQGDAFEVMEALHKQGKQFDIVLADPPAFVKQRKDIAAGLKGYAKVARLAAQLVKPEGLLFMASCSHHAGRSAFNKAVLDGVAKTGRSATILKQTGAAADHPLHSQLPQSEYLKGLLIRVQ